MKRGATFEKKIDSTKINSFFVKNLFENDCKTVGLFLTKITV